MGAPPPGRRAVRFYDSTLRKSLLLPGGRLKPAAHVRIAEALVEAGVAGIFYNMLYDRRRLADDPKAQENQAAVRAVARRFTSVRRVACLYAFPASFDWKQACELSLEAGLDMLEPGIPISDAERKADLPGVSRSAVAERLIEAIAYCRSLGVDASANFTDVGRADPEHLVKVARMAVDAGAAALRLSDSYSALSPEGVHNLVRLVRAGVGKRVPLMVHIHDDYGMASAATVAAALEGCDVDTTVGGLGDKGGFAALEEVALALKLLYGMPITLRLDRLPALARRVESETGLPVGPTKAVIGRDIFNVEHDAAVARLLRGTVTFDDPGARVVSRTFDPALIGRQRTLIWGQTTLGGAATRTKLEQLRLPTDAATVARVNGAIRRRLSTRDRYPCWISEAEVEGLCRRLAAPRRSVNPGARRRRGSARP